MSILVSLKVIALSVVALAAVLAVRTPSDADQTRASQPGDVVWRYDTEGV